MQQPRVDDMVLSRVKFGHNVNKRTISGKGGGREEEIFPDLFRFVFFGAPWGGGGKRVRVRAVDEEPQYGE